MCANRRVIIGIDYDSYKATIVGVRFDSAKYPHLEVAQFRPTRRSGEDAAFVALGEVASSLDEALGAILMRGDLGRDSHDVFFLERGYGSSRSSDWVLGAFFGAIWTSIRTAWLRPGDQLNPMTPREWKRAVTKTSGIGVTKKGDGNGNVKKDLANAATLRIIDAYEIALTSTTPDALDAFAIAWTGRRQNRDAVAA